MPELPEVETVRRGLIPVMVGRRIATVDQRRGDLRHPFPERLAQRLQGRRVEAIDRRAKYLLVRLDDGMTILLHLGMSGSILVDRPPLRPAAKHDHLRLVLDDGVAVTFNDPRRFGSFDLVGSNALAMHPALASLGPEPLDPDFTPAVLSARLAGRRTPIKAALLDQRVVAGLGNIYVCEALYLACISPRRLAASVPGARAERLVPAIRDVLARALLAGGSTLKDFVHTDGELGYFQHDFAVYDREGQPCPGCDCRDQGRIRRIVQSGRSTFYCAARQR